MKILFATSEAVPFCKTGGLADVLGSLPKALAAAGEDVAVVLPLYNVVWDAFGSELTYLGYTYVDLAWRHEYCGVFRCEREGVKFFFLDNRRYFDRPRLYGEFDDAERFAFFSRAVPEMLTLMDFHPDVIHCNDWQTALIPVYLADENARSDRFSDVRTVFTVHNVEYQGRFGAEVLTDVCGLNAGWMADGTLAYAGDVNFMKGAILTADAVTTVSPTYARELLRPEGAHGLDGVFRVAEYKFSGVLNGIDTEDYDPAKDAAISPHYTAGRLTGKAKNKEKLQKRLGLSVRPDVPLIVMVSRLVSHKGLDLVCAVGDALLQGEVQLAVLGTGEWDYEQYFEGLLRRHPGYASFYRGYDAQLARQMYAGADLFLMPSRSEPCGLSQLIAMRYGAVPVVRETGGLRDTVHAFEAWCGKGNGFTFAAYNADDMLYVLREACALYRDDPKQFAKVRKNAMTEEHGWGVSAEEYLGIYRRLCGLA